MFSKIPERILFALRGLLFAGWALLIGIWFISWPELEAAQKWGLKVFWNLIACFPMILLVFGHEAWRRACPLSFINQIPRFLKFQRFNKYQHPLTGEWIKESLLIDKDSFLARHHLWLQFSILTVGIAMRAVLLQSHAQALALFLVVLIATALIIGYLYGGKSWCHFFCPLSPLHKYYSGTGGLFESDALAERRPVSKSMCRSMATNGQSEQSICVGCRHQCPDIDLEQNYWKEYSKSGQSLVYYGYPGLLLGFYFFHMLVLGETAPVLEGRWSTHLQQGGWLATIVLPWMSLSKVLLALAVMVLSTFTSFILLYAFEKITIQLLNKGTKHGSRLREKVRHLLFCLSTYASFNLFYLFAAPALAFIPGLSTEVVRALLFATSSIWLVGQLRKNSQQYQKSALAENLRKQLKKFNFDLSHVLGGRTIEELNGDEVSILASTLSTLKSDNRKMLYRQVLLEALDSHQTDEKGSLQHLAPFRISLGITEDEHKTILSDLREVHMTVLNEISSSEEDVLKILGYQKAMTRLFHELGRKNESFSHWLSKRETQAMIMDIRNTYNISNEDISRIQEKLLHKKATLINDIRLELKSIKKLAPYAECSL